MKMVFFLVAVSAFFVSCKHHEKITNPETYSTTNSEKNEVPVFFPVTNYIRGQIFEIKKGASNPLKIEIVDSHTDSSWIRMDVLEKEFKDFLFPEIDTANLVKNFSENKFMDETLDAITLTYDPVKTQTDTFAFRHWDIYIDPATEKVRQIYLLKKLKGNIVQYLTWLSGKSCNIKTISTDSSDKHKVEREITIKWDL